MIGLILQWRLNVTTLLMAVLSTLKCLYKTGQSSSYHRTTIWVSVLCPIPSLRSMTSEDSCNIPSYFHMALHGIYSCQHHCDNVVWTDTTDLLMLMPFYRVCTMVYDIWIHTLQLSLKVPSKWIPPPQGPYVDRHSFPEPSSTLPPTTHHSFEVPHKVAPLHVHTTESLWRGMLHLHSQWFIHSFISVRVPTEGALPQNGGKIYSYCPWSSTQMEGLHTMGCDLVPQGDLIRHSYHYPNAMQPSACYLPLWLG